MIERNYYAKLVNKALQYFPACALLGPRQCGKTTLALEMGKHFEQVHHFDLEDHLDLERFESPKIVLEDLQGLVIIDEIQRKPDLFPYLRVLLDRKKDFKLLLLGSASRELLWQASETLAGRIQYIYMAPFRLGEISDTTRLWKWGGFPKAYLAPTEIISEQWRKAYITTFLEKDLLALEANSSPQTMRKLWMMIAHYHGNILNYSELSRSLGITDKRIRRQIDLLESAFMVRILKPWHENIKKRQVKAPKIYVRDSGILHTLLGLSDEAIYKHPKLGASWEGFALEQVLFTQEIDELDCYYWRTHDGAELDLLVVKGGERIGYEFKYADVPKVTASMRIAINDLKLDTLKVIVPGDAHFRLQERIEVVGLENLPKLT